MRSILLACFIIIAESHKKNTWNKFRFGKHVANTYTNPSLENVTNTVKSCFPDPLMGQHNMQGTYSNQSTAKDFLDSGVKAVVAAHTEGTSML